MIDIKEIQCFIECVNTKSFSKAAERLYTSQSAVSKKIKSMEDELGIRLFERQAKGIYLTPEGRQIYDYALTIMDNFNKIPCSCEMARTIPMTLFISYNPSSWFEKTFVDFYDRHESENICYQIYSSDTRGITSRIQDRNDDLGFVYIMKMQLPAFHYYLSRNYLEFIPLKETSVMVYGGGRESKSMDKDKLEIDQLKLIQRFPDEFSLDNYWNIIDENGGEASHADIMITTNSNYVMEQILKRGHLANISPEYLTGKPRKSIQKGIKLEGYKSKVLFGYYK